jgi:hypothetical protein
MQQPTKRKPEAIPPRGVIASVAEGWSIVIGRPWLILPVILVDLWYWLGWRIEPQALMRGLVDLAQQGNPGDVATVVDALEQTATADMSALVSFFLPTLLGGAPADNIYRASARPVFDSGSAGIDFLLGAVLILVGALLFMAYAVPIADRAVGRVRDNGDRVAAIGRAWLRFLLLLALLVAAVFAVAIPLAILVAITALGGVNLMPLVSSAMVLAGVIALLYGYFSVDAMLVADVGPINGLRYSLNVVRRNFLPTLGFVFTTLLISIGVPEIMTPMLKSLPGLLLALGIHAFVATGMVAASMVFFVDRLRRWRPEIAPSSAAPVTDAVRQGEPSR